MVFSSAWLAAAARVPAELCQGPPRPGQRRRLRDDEVLRALFEPPVHELERLAGCLYLFFCMPLPDPDEYNYVPASGAWVARRPGVLYSYRRSLSVSSSSSSSSSSSWVDDEEGRYYSDA
ncbi:hypothetical protein QYE76_040188 [Lolium multiflorum]|uniref:Uncharacterized protein n=1 Tax=Lolium multiflorum TaxID=4521 RepID=A0AAD8TAR4_LOLMU|nr:hypothetical protein QYE76_040188 [Lolium multiflorum]